MLFVDSLKESQTPGASLRRVEEGWARLPALRAFDSSDPAHLGVAATLRAYVDAIPCVRTRDGATLTTRRERGGLVAEGRYSEDGAGTFAIRYHGDLVMRHTDGEGYTTLVLGSWCEELREAWVRRERRASAAPCDV